MSGEVAINRKSLYGFEMRKNNPDKRRKDESRKTYNVKQLWQRTHEILKLALLGMNTNQIATVLGLHKQTVSNTLNSDLGMQKLSEMRLARDKGTIDVAQEVAKLLPEALKVYKEIMANKEASPSLKKDVADTLLMDIGGHRAPTKIEGKVAHAHLTSLEIEEIKRRGLEAARSQGQLVEPVVDAEVIEDGDEKGVPVHT